MNKTKHLMVIGIVFLACGVTFLSVGLATGLAAMWAVGPAFMAMGVVFMATSNMRAKSDGTDTSGEA